MQRETGAGGVKEPGLWKEEEGQVEGDPCKLWTLGKEDGTTMCDCERISARKNPFSTATSECNSCNEDPYPKI